MSEQCHVCGPVKHEDPTVICAPCALLESNRDRVRAAVKDACEDVLELDPTAPP